MKYCELQVGKACLTEKFPTFEGLGCLKTKQANKPSFIMNMQGTCQSCGAVGPNLWACLQVKMACYLCA